MYQQWLRLLFLHWRFQPELIQKTLPRGLQVDVYDESAWVGIVPFEMQGVRPARCPAIFGISNFPELNLRTYVLDREGRPGVWFYSLDASQPVAVWIARQLFHLPYYLADMRASLGPTGVHYRSRRKGTPQTLVYRYSPTGPQVEAAFGSLEFFLVERYRLFGQAGTRLTTGRVYHQPYRLSGADLEQFDAGLFALNALPTPGKFPDHIAYSDRVDVEVYAAEKL
jgi:uncharacterized protein